MDWGECMKKLVLLAIFGVAAIYVICCLREAEEYFDLWESYVTHWE